MNARARIAEIDFEAAAGRLRGVVRRTPLVPFDAGDGRIELRLKMECLQETGAFKARGAWNNVERLTPEERRAGVIATSSGNHGGALAWAAQRAGVRATIVMPANAYPNKVAACRERGAEVVMAPDRRAAEAECARRVAAGARLVHPFDDPRTVEGAGTVGLEIAEDWPAVEVLVVPVGGGGLLAGSSLAIRRRLGAHVRVVAAEPSGAPTLARALEADRPVVVEPITTAVQGLCPLALGEINLAVCRETVDACRLLTDDQIFGAQAALVRAGHVVEPAGAAAVAVLLEGLLPDDLLEARGADDPLRVAAVVSGGNPDPAQLAELRAAQDAQSAGSR